MLPARQKPGKARPCRAQLEHALTDKRLDLAPQPAYIIAAELRLGRQVDALALGQGWAGAKSIAGYLDERPHAVFPGDLFALVVVTAAIGDRHLVDAIAAF